jgi:hypothetical protein
MLVSKGYLNLGRFHLSMVKLGFRGSSSFSSIGPTILLAFLGSDHLQLFLIDVFSASGAVAFDV